MTIGQKYRAVERAQRAAKEAGVELRKARIALNDALATAACREEME